MKREGGTTFLKHFKFERSIFRFGKTPNGRLVMISREDMKKLLTGMSPDLTDNIILLCGCKIYDCYRILRDDAGVMKRHLNDETMLSLLNINGEQDVDTRIQRKKIRNASEVLNILSSI
jgi:hypothetical protein